MLCGVSVLAVVWYVVTVAIISGCDNLALSQDVAAPGAVPGRSLMRIGAIAMSKFRKTLDKMKTSDGLADENVFIEHAPKQDVAGEEAQSEDDDTKEGKPAPAAAASSKERGLKLKTITDPKVSALTKRLLAVLEKEKAVGAESSDFEGLAISLASAVVSAEAEGADFTSDPSEVPPPEYTQQTCYLQTDESEICVYDGVLCYDGKSPVVTVETPVRTPERILDYTHYCSDFRYYEPSAMEYSGCAYKHPFERAYKYEWPMLPSTDFPLPLARRRWGPQNRNGHLYFKEVSPSEIWGRPADGAGESVSDQRSDGNPGVDGAVDGPFDFSPSKTYVSQLVTDTPFPFDTNLSQALRIGKRTRVGNRTIDWVDGHLWLAGIDGQFWQNP